MMQKRNSGFTLMEVIGVLAVIAILAAVATPQIFQAIQDAKVTAMVQTANELKAAVARYYRDTGKWPSHIPGDANDQNRQLMKNTDGASPIPGWDGPYLEAELTNTLSPGSLLQVAVTSDSNYACDLDGDGNGDGTFITFRIDGVSDDIAEDISHMLDKDRDNTTGNTDWRKAGRVKRYAGTHTSILIMCLARV